MLPFLFTLLLLSVSAEQIAFYSELTSLSNEAENSFDIAPVTPSQIERHRHPLYYYTKVSEKRRAIWFMVYKNASGSISSILNRKAPDFKGERLSHAPEEYRDYYKFAFVRNPWDRIVSFYFHKIITRKSNRFKECFDKDFQFFVHYIKHIDIAYADAHIRLQTRLIPVEQCDFIGRIDHFEEDFQHVCNVLGIEMGELVHRHQTGHRHYSTYYNRETREIIASLYREDINTFGFEFEDVELFNDLQTIESEGDK